MPPYSINMLVESAQTFVTLGQTVFAMLLFVGAGTVFRLAYHQWAAAAGPAEDEDRALLARPRVRPASRIAFPVAGVDNGRVNAYSTAARPRAPVLSSPSALVSHEAFQKGEDNIARPDPLVAR